MVAFGRRDTPSAGNGVPTIAIPAGANPHGQPVNIQLMGRAWDDAKLVGFAYAFERLANAAGSGHVPATTVPRLRRVHESDDDESDDDRAPRSASADDDDWDRWGRK
jgi:amidase